MNALKVTSWNICLGISNKLYYIKKLLSTENIDILFIREAECQNQTNRNFYQIENYTFITSDTIHAGKSRLCCYVKKTIKYKQNRIRNSTVELISLVVGNLTINGIYRPFKIPHHNNHKEYFTELTEELINLPKTTNNALMGDFNLDSSKKNKTTTNTKSLKSWTNTLTNKTLCK